tara:strand:+ start:951 stop:2675 length:1725 start_codon:yes stop_codon:yes gene_type:complete
MSDRGMSTAVLTEIAKSQNQPFHLIEIYFDSGTVYMTDSFKDISWNSNTYLAGGSFLTFTDITEQNAITVSDIEVQLSGVDRSVMVTILSENFMDRELIIRKGFLNSSSAVIVDPIIVYSGKMDEPTIVESAETCTVAVKVANLFVDFLKSNGRYTNNESQHLIFPDDNGFAYAYQIIKQIDWGKEGSTGAGSWSKPPWENIGMNYIIPSFTIGTVVGLVPTLIYGGGIDITAGVSTATVNAIDHGLLTGDLAEIEGALAIGQLPVGSINKLHTITKVDSQTFTFPITETITTTVPNGGGAEYTINGNRYIVPIVKTQITTNSSNVVTVTDPYTEVTVGTMVSFDGFPDIGGIPDWKLNTDHVVSSVLTNSYNVDIIETLPIDSPPIITTSSSTTVDIEMANNIYNIGDTVVVTGAVDTGGIAAANINGTQTITAVKENSISFVSSDTATSTTRGGGVAIYIDDEKPFPAPIETTASSTALTLNEVAHGLVVGDSFTLLNIMPVANIPPSELNKEHTVASVPDANTVTFAVTTSADTTTKGGGSESKVMLPVKATSAVRGGGIHGKVGGRNSVL